MEGESEHKHEYELIINRREHKWQKEIITGTEIKTLAGSPPDWVVNEIIDGPGDDPEIGDSQEVNLDRHAPPKGIKRFTTRKPKTTPGA